MAYSKKTGSSGKASMSRKYGAKTGKRRAAPFGRVSPGLAKAVKAIVTRQAEVKYCAQQQQDLAIVQQQILLPPPFRWCRLAPLGRGRRHALVTRSGTRTVTSTSRSRSMATLSLLLPGVSRCFTSSTALSRTVRCLRR